MMTRTVDTNAHRIWLELCLVELKFTDIALRVHAANEQDKMQNFVFLGRVVAVCMAKAAYGHRTFSPTICWVVCLSGCLSVWCIVAKRLIGYGYSLGR